MPQPADARTARVASTPPTVAARIAGSSGHSCPCVGERRVELANEVPAPTVTVRSVGLVARRRRPARAPRRPPATGPPTSHCVRAPTGDDRVGARRPPPRRRARSDPRALRHPLQLAAPAAARQHLQRVRARRRDRTRRAAAPGRRGRRARTAAASGRASRCPTPCSPVSTPPAAMHVSRISVPAACTRSHTPGSRRRTRCSGCRLPSPAWNTFIVMRSCVVGDLVDAPQHLDELGARARPRRAGSSRARCGRSRRTPTCGPSTAGRVRRRRRRRARSTAPCAARDLAYGVDLVGDTVGEPVDLDEQHGLGVARVAGADEVLDRAGDAARPSSRARPGSDAGRDDAAHGRGRGLDRVEGAQHRRDRGRVGREPHRDPGRDAHRALGADEAARGGRSRACRARARRARADLAVGEHDVDREHVRRRDARRRGSAGRRRWWRRCRRSCRPAATTDRARSAARGGATARVRSRLSTPGSTHATRACGSTSSTRFIWVVTITTGSPSGVAPPARPVPLPRATNGRPCRRAIAHRGRDLVGRPRPAHGDRARPSRTPASRAYSASSSGSALAPVRTERGAEIGEERVVRSCYAADTECRSPTEHVTLTSARTA